MNPMKDVKCTVDIISNAAVAFYIDLIEYPQFKDMSLVIDSMTDLINLHQGARHAECQVQGELLTIIVHGTVNPVTMTTAAQDD